MKQFALTWNEQLPNESIYDYPGVASRLTPGIRLITFLSPIDDNVYDDRDAALNYEQPIDAKALGGEHHRNVFPSLTD